MKKETQLHLACTKYLKINNIPYIDCITSTNAGTADVCACLNGKYVEVEFKVDGNSQSKAQLIREQEVILNEGEYWLIRDLKEFKSEIDKRQSNISDRIMKKIPDVEIDECPFN